MSPTILASSIPAKGKILKLISEVQQMDWKPIDQEIADDERCEEYENGKKMVEDERGILNLINEEKEALIVLAKYKKNTEAEIGRIGSKQGVLLSQAHQSI
ncbi:unnamed protein product [Onchocerca ochengi]|uniref:Gag-pol polyprotein n=1 Tax=Onchocerca ochengi TaxID=42157 RepID=A0A182EF78_ONCOC|nr:unnamed protein product [Onchocerca ochengi]